MAGSIILKPIEARLERNISAFGKMDPYCVAVLGTTELRGQVCKHGGARPMWGDGFVMAFNEGDRCFIQVKDKEVFKDSKIGLCEINLKTIMGEGTSRRWYELFYRRQRAGEILVEATYTDQIYPTKHIIYTQQKDLKRPEESTALPVRALGKHIPTPLDTTGRILDKHIPPPLDSTTARSVNEVRVQNETPVGQTTSQSLNSLQDDALHHHLPLTQPNVQAPTTLPQEKLIVPILPTGSTPINAQVIQNQQPITQPPIQPVTQPIVQPVIQPIVQPITQPMIQPVTQPTITTQPPSQLTSQPPVKEKKKTKGWGLLNKIKKALDLDTPTPTPTRQVEQVQPPQPGPVTVVENVETTQGNLVPLKRRRFEGNPDGGLSVTAPNLGGLTNLTTTQTTKPSENTLSSTILERKRPALQETQPQYVDTLRPIDKENIDIQQTIKPTENIASHSKEFEVRRDYYKDANSSINRAKELADRYSNRYEPINTRVLGVRNFSGENDLNVQDMIDSNRPESSEKSNILVEDISNNEKRGLDLSNINRGYQGYKAPIHDKKSVSTNAYGRGKVEDVRPRFR